MSLKQHGIKTAINRKINTPVANENVITPPKAIMIWNNDAHVLNRTCPAWGNFVFGLK